ncbi:MAG: transposase [Thermales bacterium]|nr:transposase [Thermales bacterium]
MNIQHPVTTPLIENTNLSSTDNHLQHLFSCFNKSSSSGRKRILSFHQVLGFLACKQKYSCNTWLGLHRCLVDNGYILPHYSNFLKTIKLSIRFLLLLIDYVVSINKHIFLQKQFKIALVDSTCLPVCHIKRSSRHKTMKKSACYSKSTMGWYYGHKLHVTCDYETQDIIDYEFSMANLDDRKYLASILTDESKFKNIGSLFVCDKGYQAKWLQELAIETNNYLLSGEKKSKNNKTLASLFDIHLLHVRARIESVFSTLKVNHNLTNTRSRSVLGYLFNYTLALYGVVCCKSQD